MWSKVNKEKIQRLTNERLTTKAGYEIIETAKQNGSWTVLDEAEALIIPDDLDIGFQKRTNAKEYFLSLGTDRTNEIFYNGLFLLNDKKQEKKE